MTVRQYKVSDIAARVGGSFIGDGSLIVSALCSVASPLPRGISFVKSASVRSVLKAVADCPGVVLVVSHKIPASSLEGRGTFVLVADPQRAIIDLIPLFVADPPRPQGIHPKADIAQSAVVGPESAVGAFAVIGEDVIIGANTTIYPHVVIYPGARIGSRCILHAGCVIREGCLIGDDVVVQNGAVIGSDGFGFIPGILPSGGRGLITVPQVGRAVIRDGVDIGANTCVDRGALGDTAVGQGSKLDNLVQIGHNTTIGSQAIICGQVGIAGSCTIGDGVILGGAVGVADHLNIQSGVRVGGGSAVTSSLDEPGDYVGFPAMPATQWRRNQVALRDAASALRAARRVMKGTP